LHSFPPLEDRADGREEGRKEGRKEGRTRAKIKPTNIPECGKCKRKLLAGAPHYSYLGMDIIEL